ncbi:sarcosine oxidase subunit alpha [Paenibacillus endophyticus]|uniref:Sarcosine oxidase subunit alpha n=1 Tax=Paenibacillus endophyticus TaxID=1294268 RepID=A0A7W5CBL5_9BACL|nr:(2Fe-2S)-binding protein [Paenibacillus endophyticus]MBB3154685.1 sarcosine oxidase subunit alpha [Paenibacillus endophyticus]
MSYGRIEHHPVLGPLPPAETCSFSYDGRLYKAREGESIAAALLAGGVRTLRLHEENGSPRGIYCNIGHCMECRVTIGGITGVRACLTPVKEGMDVRSGTVLPTPFRQMAEDERSPSL